MTLSGHGAARLIAICSSVTVRRMTETRGGAGVTVHEAGAARQASPHPDTGRPNRSPAVKTGETRPLLERASFAAVHNGRRYSTDSGTPLREAAAVKGGPVEKFRPSIDWGDELAASALWILEAWAVSAAAVLVVVVMLGRFTVWGRRFWRVTGGYFTGAASVRVWGVLAVLLCLGRHLGAHRRIAQLLQQRPVLGTSGRVPGRQRARRRAARFRNTRLLGRDRPSSAMLATITVARIVFDTYLTQRFIIAWRVWLTDRLTGDWLSDERTTAVGSRPPSWTTPISASSRTSTS